jgi:hypothetical protein
MRIISRKANKFIDISGGLHIYNSGTEELRICSQLNLFIKIGSFDFSMEDIEELNTALFDAIINDLDDIAFSNAGKSFDVDSFLMNHKREG